MRDNDNATTMLKLTDVLLQAPRWACFLCALGLFVYQSLDAIDGKQARRTGTSTPLGELFDHGCDSISTGRRWILTLFFVYLVQREGILS